VSSAVNTSRWIFETAEARGEFTAGDEDIDEELYRDLLWVRESTPRGAPVTYTRYEAQDGETNADVLTYSTRYLDIQSEASGRQCVLLSRTNHYVRWVLTEPADCFVIRYSVPDSADGNGQDFTLSMFADNDLIAAPVLTSKQTWNYGAYPWTNNPNDGSAHNFFAETRVILPEILPAGTVIRLQKGVHDYSDRYWIDLIEAELLPPPIPMPEGAVSLADYGDDGAAFTACVADAVRDGKTVYIPPGRYVIDKMMHITAPVTVTGAGWWHTELENASFLVTADNFTLSDMSLKGYAVTRRDQADPAAVESGSVRNITVKNMWITHYKVGVWLNGANGAVLENLRIRNTFADGINFHAGVTDGVIRYCDLRSTGDDAIGLWSANKPNMNIEIAYNNIALPWLANGIGVYGGGDIYIRNNIISDTVYNGAGINISTNFRPQSPEGSEIRIEHNLLLRCGSKGDGGDKGAVWFNTAMGYDNKADIYVEFNTIADSPWQGVSFENGGFFTAAFTGNLIQNSGTYGVDIMRAARGSAVFDRNVITGSLLGRVRDDSEGRFEFTELQAESGFEGSFGFAPPPDEPVDEVPQPAPETAGYSGEPVNEAADYAEEGQKETGNSRLFIITAVLCAAVIAAATITIIFIRRKKR
jgi:hypothetical protein